MSLPRLSPWPCVVAAYRLVAALSFAFVALALPAHADELADASRLLKQGQQPQALEKVDQYLAAKPKDAQGRFLKGLILTEMSRSQEAIVVFTKLTEDYPELPEPYNNLAVIYAQQKQYDKAKQALEMAIRTHPSYATAHENLGDIYARMASQAYDKALQIDSSNTSAQTKLALIRELMSTAGRRPTTTLPAASVAAKSPGATVAAAPVAPTRPVEDKPAESKPPVAASPAVVAPGNAAEAKPAAVDNSADISRSIEAWAQAWSKKNVKAYLGFYAKDFHTPGGESRAAWEAGRTKRIAKPGAIQVGIENLRVQPEAADRATVKFRQHYQSAALKTSSNKVMVLVKRDGKWFIQQERVGK